MLALRSRRTDVVWICRPGPHTRACSVRLDHGLRSLSHRNTRSEKDIVAGSGARRLGMFVLSRSRPTAGPNRGRRRQASSCSTRMTQKDRVLSQILGGRSDANDLRVTMTTARIGHIGDIGMYQIPELKRLDDIAV